MDLWLFDVVSSTSQCNSSVKELFETYHDVSALGTHGHGETVGNSQKGKNACSVESVHLDFDIVW